MDQRSREPVRPEDLRARHEVLFHVVGVHLDEARGDIVALDVDGARQADLPGSTELDAVLVEDDGAGQHLGVFEDEPGVGENGLHQAAFLGNR